QTARTGAAPPPPRIIAEAVDREVHPDLADAAEGRKYQFVLRHAASAWPAERALLAAHSEGEHIAGRYCLDSAVLNFKHQAAGLIEANKAAVHFSLAVAHCNRLADAACLSQPIAQNGGPTPAPIPPPPPPPHCGRQPGK